jgi:S-adenosylmethionine/arginine decarboxylase-like enzyme
MKPLGQHYLLECDGVEAELLANPTQLQTLLYMAAQAAQAQVLFAIVIILAKGKESRVCCCCKSHTLAFTRGQSMTMRRLMCLCVVKQSRNVPLRI